MIKIWGGPDPLDPFAGYAPVPTEKTGVYAFRIFPVHQRADGVSPLSVRAADRRDAPSHRVNVIVSDVLSVLSPGSKQHFTLAYHRRVP
ncbi:hypothetical protein J6590_003640 [Homalodisca vitripennis]|nr:hypothetical protein J6590_003640 [Homalodisca vitripennis]